MDSYTLSWDSYTITWDSYTILPLECQGDHRAARGDLDIFDVVNKPGANGFCRVHRVRLPGEGPYAGLAELRSLLDDGTDPRFAGREVANDLTGD
jgi:hypothetical protein